MDISEIIENPMENNKEYLQITKNLNKACTDFINNSNNDEMFDLNKLPDIEEYKKIAEMKEYYQNLYDKIRIQSLNNIFQTDDYFKELTEAKQQIECLQNDLNKKNEQIEVLKKQNSDVNQKLTDIENSKTYRIAEKMKGLLPRK